MRGADREDRPLIGITGPDGWYHVAWRCTGHVLRHAGARVVRLTPRGPARLPALAGVVIGGGDDIDPALYAGLDDGTGSYDRQRDRLLFRFVRMEEALTTINNTLAAIEQQFAALEQSNES